MSPTLAISMMVTGLVLLVAVGFLTLVLACLAVVLLRESNKLDGAADLVKDVAASAADVTKLKAGLNAIEELVAVKLNRMATTEKRTRARLAKEEDRGDELNLPNDIEFPSRAS